MATGNTLYIVNYFPQAVDVAVTNNAWNCCDAPKPGYSVGQIQPNSTASMPYVRTDGHGCNGRQGQFELSIESTNLVDLNFDADGNIQLSATPTTFGAYLQHDPDGTYTLVVGPYAGATG